MGEFWKGIGYMEELPHLVAETYQGFSVEPPGPLFIHAHNPVLVD